MCIRDSLLMLYACLSMAVSVVTTSARLMASPDQADDGVQLELLLIDRTLIFCHGVALAGLFGFSAHVVGPIASTLRRYHGRLAACLVGHEEAPLTAFPRSASGFWG